MPVKPPRTDSEGNLNFSMLGEIVRFKRVSVEEQYATTHTPVFSIYS